MLKDVHRKDKPYRKRPQKKLLQMSKYQEKPLIKYECLVAKETCSKEMRDFLGQDIDFVDHFLDNWKKYD
jgi:hypothetical protein